MPLQEYLASYAVRVDEDGARRLQRILEQNRESASGLAEAFSSARSALAALKAELSDTSGIRSSLASLSLGSLGGSGGQSSSSAGASGSSGSASLSSISGGSAAVSVSADMSSAEKSLDSYKSRAEALRPKLNVNTSGITSSVSSAIASVRSMMSSFTLTIPVKVKATLDTSGLPTGSGGSSAGSLSSSTGSGRGTTSTTLSAYGQGGRVSRPTLAMIAEEGDPEYVIPVKNEARALPLLRSLMGELSASARAALAGVSAPEAAGTSAPAPASVQAPVNIYVTSSAAPEAVGQSIYDTARRSLLKTLEGVFT